MYYLSCNKATKLLCVFTETICCESTGLCNVKTAGDILKNYEETGCTCDPSWSGRTSILRGCCRSYEIINSVSGEGHVVFHTFYI